MPENTKLLTRLSKMPGYQLIANCLEFVNRKRLIFKGFSFGIFALSMLLFLPTTIFRDTATGLDPSWMIGINLARSNHLVFGKDIVFTYGPLGYLSTRLPIGVSSLHYVVWDVFLYSNIAYILIYAIRKLDDYFSVFLVFLTSLLFSIISPTSINLDYLFIIIMIFMLYHYLASGKLFALAMASVAFLFTFYYKGSAATACLMALLLFFVYVLIYPKWHSRRFIIFFAGCVLVTLVTLSYPLRTDLWN